MILRYFIIATKDKEGFVIPYCHNRKAPFLYPSEEKAKEDLELLKGVFRDKLNYVPPKPAFSLFRKETTPELVTEERKTEMRWFLANATVKGVTLNL